MVRVESVHLDTAHWSKESPQVEWDGGLQAVAALGPCPAILYLTCWRGEGTLIVASL